MTRLWDKGAPLDARVLRYTAGEDYALDERLVPYDVRASLAHAEMLHAQQLLSAEDLAALRSALEALGAEHGRGAWHIELGGEALRPQPHRARHGLLHVRVARERGVRFAGAQLAQRLGAGARAGGQLRHHVAQVQAQRRQQLVVA